MSDDEFEAITNQEGLEQLRSLGSDTIDSSEFYDIILQLTKAASYVADFVLNYSQSVADGTPLEMRPTMTCDMVDFLRAAAGAGLSFNNLVEDLDDDDDDEEEDDENPPDTE